MNKLGCLLALELRSLYGINTYRHTKDQKAKNRYRGLCVAWALLVLMAFAYIGGLVFGLYSLGLGEVAPAYLVVLASMLVLAFGIFTAGNRIFGQTAYDLLAPLPLRPGLLVLSRFLSMYVEDLLLTLLIFLPGVVTYGCCMRPQWSFYPLALLGALLVPGIPLVISTVLGTLVMVVSSRVKGKSLVQSVLPVLVVVGTVVGSIRLGTVAEELTPEAFRALAVTITALLERLYPPALWLARGMTMASPAEIGGFLLLTLGLVAVTVFLVTRKFQHILEGLGSLEVRHSYQLGTLESKPLWKTLYLRELKRYFSSSIYVTNTIIGPILAAIMAVALALSGTQGLNMVLQVNVRPILPFVLSGVFCMMTTTSVSISMEGKEFWILRSLPVPTKAWLDAKLLLNLSLMLPCYLVSEAALVMALKPEAWSLVWLVLIPALMAVFSTVFGLTVNLKFHSFDWAKEETVVKQSLPAMLGGMSGLVLSLVLGGTVFVLPGEWRNPAMALMCLVLLAGAWWLYQRNHTVSMESL